MGAVTKYGISTALAALQPAALAYSELSSEHRRTAVIVGGAAGVLAALWGAASTYTLDRENKKLRRLNVLAAACWAILDLQVVKSEELGLHAFRFYKRTVLHPFRGEHVRRVRLRPSRPLPESPGSWAGDKGAIGYARVDWPSSIVWWQLAAHPLRNYINCSTTKWRNAPDTVRMGFSQDEWNRVANRYAGIVVIPIIKPGGRMRLGCVTLDCETDAAYLSLLQKRREIEAICQDAANSMAEIID